jgi:zinc protease
MAAALFGPSHPYGFSEIGTEISNKAMMQDDLQKYWAKNFVANNAALIVSGKITDNDLKPLVDKAFGDWQKGTPAADVAGQPPTTTPRLGLVDKPRAPQTQLRVASIGVPRNTPDYAALRVLNEALGGLFSSRINLNLREAHGYTYGAFSQFVFRRAAGPFLVGTGVRTNVTGPAVSEILKELKRIRESDLNPNELSLARDSLIRSLPADFETSGSATATTANIFIYDLGLDYYSKLPERFSAVNAANVRAAAEKYIAPDKMIVVAVGDRSKINGELQKQGLGAVEARNPDGTRAGAAARAASVR